MHTARRAAYRPGLATNPSRHGPRSTRMVQAQFLAELPHFISIIDSDTNNLLPLEPHRSIARVAGKAGASRLAAPGGHDRNRDFDPGGQRDGGRDAEDDPGSKAGWVVHKELALANSTEPPLFETFRRSPRHDASPRQRDGRRPGVRRVANADIGVALGFGPDDDRLAGRVVLHRQIDRPAIWARAGSARASTAASAGHQGSRSVSRRRFAGDPLQIGGKPMAYRDNDDLRKLVRVMRPDRGFEP